MPPPAFLAGPRIERIDIPIEPFVYDGKTNLKGHADEKQVYDAFSIGGLRYLL